LWSRPLCGVSLWREGKIVSTVKKSHCAHNALASDQQPHVRSIVRGAMGATGSVVRPWWRTPKAKRSAVEAPRSAEPPQPLPRSRAVEDMQHLKCLGCMGCEAQLPRGSKSFRKVQTSKLSHIECWSPVGPCGPAPNPPLEWGSYQAYTNLNKNLNLTRHKSTLRYYTFTNSNPNVSLSTHFSADPGCV